MGKELFGRSSPSEEDQKYVSDWNQELKPRADIDPSGKGAVQSIR